MISTRYVITAEFKNNPSDNESANAILSFVLVDQFSISAILWKTSAKTNLLNSTITAEITNDKLLIYENAYSSSSPFYRSSYAVSIK